MKNVYISHGIELVLYDIGNFKRTKKQLQIRTAIARSDFDLFRFFQTKPRLGKLSLALSILHERHSFLIFELKSKKRNGNINKTPFVLFLEAHCHKFFSFQSHKPKNIIPYLKLKEEVKNSTQTSITVSIPCYIYLFINLLYKDGN